MCGRAGVFSQKPVVQCRAALTTSRTMPRRRAEEHRSRAASHFPCYLVIKPCLAVRDPRPLRDAFPYRNPFVRRALGELLRVTRHRVEERHREPSPPEWALCVLNPCLDLHDWHTPCGPWTLVPRTPRTSCDACRPPPRRLASRAARCTSVARWHTSRGVHAATARFRLPCPSSPCS